MKEDFKINADLIQRAKQADLPALFRKNNIDLIPTNNGSSFKSKCPFHEDKEPSLNMNIRDGAWLWNCFGCSTGGTAIDFAMKYESLNFKEAVEKLSLSPFSDFKSLNQPQSHIKEISLIERIKLLNIASNHFHKILTENEPNARIDGKSYLEKRGLNDNFLIKEFKIGFSDGRAKLDLKDYRTDLRIKVGLFTESYYETFANCVIFPVMDEQGNTTDLYGRRTMTYSNRSNHCYNTGEHIGIFNLKNIKDSNTVILTESIIDALSIYKTGFKSVTALYGAGGFTKAIESVLNKKKKLILALDNDETGKKASLKICSKLIGAEILNVIYPDNIKDMNELLCKSGVDAVKNAIENAKAFKSEEPEEIKPAISSEIIIEDKITNKFTFKGKDLIYQTDSILYVIKNVLNLKELDSLRFIITATYKEQCCRDRIDLYLSRSRKGFESAASKTFNLQPAVIENDLSKIIDYIEKDFANRGTSKETSPQKKELTEKEKQEAYALLKSSDLIKQILEDITILGYIGEDANKLLLYLGATSRLLDKAISILIRSQSSSGKSYLIKLICNLLPAEDVHKWTRATPQALYYMPEDALKHKFIAIDEKEGIEEAEYPIRSLQSEGSITLSVPIKNPTTGQTVTEMIVKEGPIAYVDGSTDTRVNPENANRCFEIYLDESELQTQHIHKAQKQEYELNSLANNILKETIKRKHQNAQRLLKPLKVIIPYVNEIKFPTDRVRTRRDHDRFLLLIACITFLHQCQREVKKYNDIEYIESNLKDYAIAYKIASVVIFNTFQELEKPVFDFYFIINRMVEEKAKEQGINIDEYFFTRRMVRSFSKLPDYLVKRYMRTLSDLEYLTFKGDKQGSRFVYRLIKNINEKQKIEGLLTPEELRCKLNDKQNKKHPTEIAMLICNNLR